MRPDRALRTSIDAPLRVRIGGLEVATDDERITTSVNDFPRADFVLRAGADPVDYAANVTAEIGGSRLFTGSVQTATPTPDGLRLHCAAGTEMSEVLLSSMATEDCSVQDIVFAAARGAGFADEDIQIHELDRLPLEPFEVVVPLSNLSVAGRRQVGNVTLVPPSVGVAALQSFRSIPEKLHDEFERADCHGIVVHTTRTLAHAESHALAEIDVMLAWLTARARYGLAHSPNGTALRYVRSEAMSAPRRRDVLSVRGLRTQRRWLRDPRDIAREVTLSLGEASGHLWPPLPSDASPSDRQALLAARRAVVAADPIQRTTAMWEAWEFYAGTVELAPQFDKDELSRLRNDLPEWLNKGQRKRVLEVLELVGGFPLMQRLRVALAEDGVPMSTEEWRALKRLRRTRNRSVHGAKPSERVADDLALGCSLLSRALVFRFAKASRLA